MYFDKIKQLINSGDQRTRALKRNALGSLLIRAISMGIDFAKVPLLLSLLDSELYGLYVTIYSIVYWAYNFDFGLGTGLRYKLTRAIALKDFNYGRKLVSTAYFSLAGIMSIVFICATPIICCLDWNSLLNSNVVSNKVLILSIIVVLAVITSQFVLELISNVLQSFQRTALSTFFKPLANFITIIVILILKLFMHNNLFVACLSMTLPFVIVLFLANIYFFNEQYSAIKPSFHCIRKECLKDIYSLGLKYFVGQLSTMIVFNTASFIISHYVNPVDAAVYNTAFTYFGLIVMINTMVMQPLIPAVTDAFTMKDYTWLKKCMSKTTNVSVVLTICSVIMLAISQFVFNIWIGDKLTITWTLSIAMTIYFILNIWTTPYSSFLSGVGKMNISMYLGIFKTIAYIPFAIIMVKKFGTIGIIISIIIINTLPNNILYTIQYHKIVNKTATGIWDK